MAENLENLLTTQKTTITSKHIQKITKTLLKKQNTDYLAGVLDMAESIDDFLTEINKPKT